MPGPLMKFAPGGSDRAAYLAVPEAATKLLD
jgi:hypothetical protein